MPLIRPCEIPASALLMKYQDALGYADCYVTEIPAIVSQAEFVEAFYTTTLFKFERLILKWFVARPSTDAEAQSLAAGNTMTFAAWRIESRSANQLLMADYLGRTRSWLMATPVADPVAGQNTRLYFGSAVVPHVDSKTGKVTMGFAFHALGGFHRLYSRLLLRAASRRLLATSRE